MIEVGSDNTDLHCIPNQPVPSLQTAAKVSLLCPGECLIFNHAIEDCPKFRRADPCLLTKLFD